MMRQYRRYLDLSRSTVPTVGRYEKYGVFRKHPKTPYFSQRRTVGIVEREKFRYLPQINCTGNCSIKILSKIV